MDAKDFYRYVQKDKNGCWNWTRARRKGYGVVALWGGQMLAHRASYELTKGPIPKGKSVCHSCDNPSCVNPAHLWLGSHKENMHDSIKKGRNSRPPTFYGDDHYTRRKPHLRLHGSAIGTSTRSEAEVIAIRQAYVRGEDLSIICKTYNVSESALPDYTSGRSWKHLLGKHGCPTFEELKAENRRRRRNGARLTADKVAAIRRRLKSGETGRALAKEYGIHFATVSDIKLRKIWPEVP